LDKVKIPGPKSKIFMDQLEQILRKNGILDTLQDVARIQSGDSVSMPLGWCPEEVAELKFCPVT